MQQKHRMAFIGYGGMAGWHHKNVAERAPEFEIVGAYDIDPKRREVAAERGLRAYESAEEVLSDPEIELIVIACPNNFHADYAIRAMRHGKHVICEKPVTMNSQELEAVMAVQRETGKCFSIHQNRRWDPDYLSVKGVIREQLIGRPYLIKSHVHGSRGIPDGWRIAPEAGGGMMLDWGVHLIDQILMMVDEDLLTVNCRMHHTHYPQVDDGFHAELLFASGLLAVIEVDTCCFVGEPRWHIRGDVGTLIIQDWEVNGQIVRAQDRHTDWEEEILYTAAGPTKTMAPRTRFSEERLDVPVEREDWIAFYHNFAAVLEGRAKPAVYPEEALYVMRVMEACFESDRRNERIHMSTSRPALSDPVIPSESKE